MDTTITTPKATVILETGERIVIEDPDKNIFSDTNNGRLFLYRADGETAKPLAIFNWTRVLGVIHGEFVAEMPGLLMGSVTPPLLKSSESKSIAANEPKPTSSSGRYTNPMLARADMKKMEGQLDSLVKECGGH